MIAAAVQNAGDPLLSVRGLSTLFETARGTFVAVDGVDLERRCRARSWAWSAKSGSGKSVTLRSIVGLVPPPGHVSGLGALAGAAIWWRCRSGELRAVRGREIAMIFQEPMTALNPVLPVGVQIDENLEAHTRLAARERGASAPSSCSTSSASRPPRRGSTNIRTSSPAACASAP